MRRSVLVISVVALVMLVGVPALAVESFVLYDDFTARMIDPSKWFGSEGNVFGSLAGVTPGFGTDAHRSIRGGAFRMSYRSYGNTVSDVTSTTSTLRLHFINPAAVTAIKATVTVRGVDLVGCPGGVTLTQAYTWSDTSPPGVSLKRLDLQNGVPDCTAPPRPRAFVDLSIDDVYVNASAAAAAAPSGSRPPGMAGGDGK